MDKNELAEARRVAERTIDLAYCSDVRKRWDPEQPPTIVLWNGGWGYDIPHVLLPKMIEFGFRSNRSTRLRMERAVSASSSLN